MARTLADFSSDEKLTPYLAELAGQSDRACGIVAAAMLETLLEQMLRKRFVLGMGDDLFVTYGPLSTFSAKVNTCAALGLVTALERRELHIVRRIRNDFAHDLHKSSFDEDPIRSYVKQLAVSRSKLIGKATSCRRDFEAAVAVLLGFMLSHLKNTTPIETPRDHVPLLAESLRKGKMQLNRSVYADSPRASRSCAAPFLGRRLRPTLRLYFYSTKVGFCTM